jgi:hypothetical protein
VRRSRSDSSSGCRRKRIDSLDADCWRKLLPSLLARIDDLGKQNETLVARIDDIVEQNKTINEQNKTLLARIAELEGRAGKPPKNSSLPPSRGQKANIADASA